MLGSRKWVVAFTMAWAMIFGLLFATILTLVIVPVFYVLFAERLRMQVVQPADSAAAGGV